MYIKRTIEPLIKANLFKKSVIIIYGPRQTGKTTLVQKILQDQTKISSKYLNCDEADIQKILLEANTSTHLKQIIGEAKLVVIDEAQRVRNIGIKLKLLTDNFPDTQIIATGSSSFELANEVNEPLTGRSLEFWLHPLSILEIYNKEDGLLFQRELETLLIFGSYPAVVTAPTLEEKKIAVSQISNNYLYKDLLKFQNLKSSEVVRKLLEALALQIGSEVSYTELGQTVGVSKQTVQSYIDILEKAFIIFKLGPFSRNLRNELRKLHKIYFYDLGIRNSLINNHNPLALRNDVGALWENFVVAERKKQENFTGNRLSLYFWRTWDKQEIDLVEEKGGKLLAYEIKWNKGRRKPPKAWAQTYPNSSFHTITKDNYFA